MTKVSQTAVFVTHDYSKFEFFPSNRPAENWPKVAKSIEVKDLTRFNPIITVVLNGKNYIIDGQNRFEACKALNLPVYYFEAKPGELLERDIKLLNTGRKDWTPMDYLHFHVKQGNESYVKLALAMEEMPLLTLQSYFVIWQSKEKNNSVSEQFKQGSYRFTDEALYKCRKVHSVLAAIAKNVPAAELRNKNSLVSAISSLTLSDNFEYTHMIEQIAKYPYLFTAQADQVHYADHLEYIYNYRKRESNKVSLRYAS